MHATRIACVALAGLAATAGGAGYVNFESSHVHPIGLTPDGTRLLAVNTPDALLEVWTVQPDGSLSNPIAIPVGLEPVSVVSRSDTEAWVVNNLSDSLSIVDLAAGVVTRTIHVGDEPTDVAFAGGKAFVAVSSEDAVKVYDPADLDSPPAVVPLFGRDVRALAVSNDGQKVYAVVLCSGNRTTVINANIIFGPNNSNLNAQRLAALGLRDTVCDGLPPAYPALPAGIDRNPTLTDPPAGSDPPVALIVRWDDVAGEWQDETGTDWSHCVPYRLADHDLFVIDTATLGVTEIDSLGTSLFDVSVHPTNGKIYVPHTEARNFVRFEHPLGVQGHVVDNRLAVVDPAAGHSVTQVDLNAHVDRGSDPATNLAERLAAISQPGMLVWEADGSAGYLTAIGSRRVFRVDGGCLSPGCIVGANRAAPDAVEVGEGPTGLALREAALPEDERLYVLNRISHSISIVKVQTLELLEQIPLHDPASAATRVGRRFLYDAIDTSGHGDAACSSCHISGDMDGLAWDLGNPEGTMVPYTTPMDNVRFVLPQLTGPQNCDASFCADHDGFDPQKGPMTTQTLRGMLEPLHWRGDRATMNDFNQAFPALMGTADIGPINGKPAGVSVEDMERFRQFALELRFPPNPFRNVDDSMPCDVRANDPGCELLVHGGLFAGNPTEGERIFNQDLVDTGRRCVNCHDLPFGTAGGKLGGVTPTEPTSTDAAALFFGAADASPHNDLKIPHLRNMYEKFGPVLAPPGSSSTPPTRSGFGFAHDGSIPDLLRFLSQNVFVLSAANQAQQVRDVASFMFHFPTGIKPSVGRQVSVPPGTPPTGSAADETLLALLVTLGDLTDANRHCELVASTLADGRSRRYHLGGGAWVTDVVAEPAVSIQSLRQNAGASITFTCTPLESGARLGGNRDEDPARDGDDCAPADGDTWAEPATVTGLALQQPGATVLTWSEQAAAIGDSVTYDVLTGTLADLRTAGFTDTACLAAGLDGPPYLDTGSGPSPGEGAYYLVRASNPCATALLGPGRETADAVGCP